MHQTHLYLVTPPKHQPEWPVNDSEPDFRLRRPDLVVGAFCFLVFLGVAVAGVVSALVLMGVLHG